MDEKGAEVTVLSLLQRDFEFTENRFREQRKDSIQLGRDLRLSLASEARLEKTAHRQKAAIELLKEQQQ
jgi:hypothetical protein